MSCRARRPAAQRDIHPNLGTPGFLRHAAAPRVYQPHPQTPPPPRDARGAPPRRQAQCPHAYSPSPCRRRPRVGTKREVGPKSGHPLPGGAHVLTPTSSGHVDHWRVRRRRIEVGGGGGIKKSWARRQVGRRWTLTADRTDGAGQRSLVRSVGVGFDRVTCCSVRLASILIQLRRLRRRGCICIAHR